MTYVFSISAGKEANVLQHFAVSSLSSDMVGSEFVNWCNYSRRHVEGESLPVVTFPKQWYSVCLLVKRLTCYSTLLCPV